jgi:hypothetical protein
MDLADFAGEITVGGKTCVLQDINPMRRVSWRADRANNLVLERTKLPLSRFDDRYVRAYHRILPGYLEMGPNLDKLRAAFGDDARLVRTCEAQLLHVETKPYGRDVVKARLLAGQTDEEIAQEAALRPQAIEYYEKIFFNVRDRLDCLDWIERAVLGPAERLATAPRASVHQQHGFCYMKIAYHGGVLPLESMINPAKFLSRINDQKEREEWLDKLSELQIKQMGLMATLLHPAEFSHPKSLKRFVQSRRGKSKVSTDDTDEQNRRLGEVLTKILGSMNGKGTQPPNATEPMGPLANASSLNDDQHETSIAFEDTSNLWFEPGSGDEEDVESESN